MESKGREKKIGSGLSTKRRLQISIAISLAFVAAEATVGIISGSLALTSDAGHNLTDTLAMGLALFAVYMAARPPTDRRTYGYGRVGILTALANALVLVAVAGVLIFEAIKRLSQVPEISGPTVWIVAAIAFVVNSIVVLLLRSHRHDLNIRSAFYHMLTDAGLSLGVVVAGIIIWTTKWYYADPLISLIISVFILIGAWSIIKEAVNVLLESVPGQIDLGEVASSLESISGVEGVHHLHIWEIGSGVYALSGHVEVGDRYLSSCVKIMDEISQVLDSKFGIVHPTIQLECSSCPPGETCVVTSLSDEEEIEKPPQPE